MNQQQFETIVAGVNDNLNNTADRLAKATTVYLEKLEELKGFNLSPDVEAIVQAMETATSIVVAETTNISQQSLALTGIVTDPS